MAKNFFKSMAIILGSMTVLAIVTIWIIGLFAQEVPTAPLEEFSSYNQLEERIFLDKNTTYEIEFPDYIPQYFLDSNYVETSEYLPESTLTKYYSIVELYSTKEKKFTHSGYIIYFHNRIALKNTPLEYIEEKIVISSVFDRKTNESIANRHIDDGGIPTVFNDNGIMDKEIEEIITIQGLEVRYFLKNSDGISDKSQLTAFFKYHGGVYKVYIEVSYQLSGFDATWCMTEMTEIIKGLVKE
jgi:hypothetical protein